jgi:hypothetical protein
VFHLSHSAGKKASRKTRDKLRKENEELKRKLKHQKKQKNTRKDSSEQPRIKTPKVQSLSVAEELYCEQQGEENFTAPRSLNFGY